MAERLQRPGVWIVLTLGLILRLWTLEQKSPWLDEAASWQFATSRLSKLLWSTAIDVHPPLYFLLLKAWITWWGDSLAALRALSVAGGMAALYFIYRLARHFVPRWVALAVLAWCAVSPLTIYYSQEARMYALATACALGACYAYVRWVDSEYRSTGALVGYGVAAVLALYLHYFTVLILVAIGSHAVALRIRRHRRPPWRAWLWTHAVIALVFLPWMGIAAAQVARGQAAWRGTIDPAGQIPAYALTLLHELGVSRLGVPLDESYTGPLVIVLLGLGLAGLAGAAIHDARARLLATITLVPLAIGLALLAVGGHMELSRYLSYAAPLVVLGAARGLAALKLRPPVVAALTVAGACALLPSLNRYYDAGVKDSDVGPIVAYLENARRGLSPVSGTVLVMPGYMHSLARYVSHNGLTARGIDTAADFSRAIARTDRARPPVWLIVDYRWPGFAALAADRRFREEPIAATTPDRIKLYRLN